MGTVVDVLEYRENWWIVSNGHVKQLGWMLQKSIHCWSKHHTGNKRIGVWDLEIDIVKYPSFLLSQTCWMSFISHGRNDNGSWKREMSMYVLEARHLQAVWVTWAIAAAPQAIPNGRRQLHLTELPRPFSIARAILLSWYLQVHARVQFHCKISIIQSHPLLFSISRLEDVTQGHSSPCPYWSPRRTSARMLTSSSQRQNSLQRFEIFGPCLSDYGANNIAPDRPMSKLLLTSS